MRVVSLVPSWTETLLECGVDVVGRSRFCVHPEARVGRIPAVGGTKDLKAEELAALRPDLVLLDKDENPQWMASCGFRVHATHIEHADDVPPALDGLAALLGNEALARLAGEWRTELARPAYPEPRIAKLPGVREWIRAPEAEPEQLVYLIWRGPWMAASRDTFVGSMLSQVGFGGRVVRFPEKYPKVDLNAFDPSKTLLLFSTEPYPFGKKTAELKALGFPCALVDGEVYSWFGVRSLRFLQKLAQTGT